LKAVVAIGGRISTLANAAGRRAAWVAMAKTAATATERNQANADPEESETSHGRGLLFSLRELIPEIGCFRRR
jgi:hypothetical protein